MLPEERPDATATPFDDLREPLDGADLAGLAKRHADNPLVRRLLGEIERMRADALDVERLEAHSGLDFEAAIERAEQADEWERECDYYMEALSKIAEGADRPDVLAQRALDGE